MVTARNQELCPRALQLLRQVRSLLGTYMKASLLEQEDEGILLPGTVSGSRFMLPMALGGGTQEMGNSRTWLYLTPCSPKLPGCLFWVFFSVRSLATLL